MTDLDQLRAVVELARRYVDADTALAMHAEENVEHSLLYDDWAAASSALVLGVRALDGGDNPLTAAIVEHRRRAELANRAADAAAEAVGAMAGKLSELLEEQGRWRTVVEAACEDLDQLAERTGHGDIGVIVERLIRELGLSYPFNESEATDG